MKMFLSNLKKIDNSVIRLSLLLLFFTIPGYILNYLFLIVAGRILSIESFGILYTSISIINVISGPAIIISFFFAKRITVALTLNGLEAAIAEFRLIIHYLLLYGIPLLFFIFILMLFFAFFIHIKSFILLFIIIVCSYSIYLAETVRASLQGLKLFIIVGIISFLWMAIRFLLGIAGLLVLKTVWGGLLGICLASIIIFTIFSFVILSKQHTPITYSYLRWDGNEIKNLSFFCLSFALFMFIMYLDNIIAYFSLNRFELGIYSTASILAKAIIVILTPIIRIFFPLMVQQNKIHKIKLTTIIKSVGITLLISSFLAIVVSLFPNYIIHLFGFKFYSIKVTRIITISAIPLCILRLLIIMHLSLDYHKYPLILLPLVIIQIILLYVYGRNIVSLTYTYIITCWILVIFYTIFSIIKLNNKLIIKAIS